MMTAGASSGGRGPRQTWRGRPLAVAFALVLLVLLVFGDLALWLEVSSVKDDVGRVERRLSATERATKELKARTGRLELESFDPVSVAESVRPSVFAILAPAGNQAFEGTAFVIARRGRRSLLVTNFHVIEGRWATGARDVLLSRGYRNYQGTIVKARPADDLALVEADVQLPVLSPAETATQVGDPVIVVGSAGGLEGTVTTGVVSSVDRMIEGQDWLQFDAPVNPGNSGGPVVDKEGAVIGVATFKAVGVEFEGLSFAIPLARLCSSLDVCEAEGS